MDKGLGRAHTFLKEASATRLVEILAVQNMVSVQLDILVYQEESELDIIIRLSASTSFHELAQMVNGLNTVYTWAT